MKKINLTQKPLISDWLKKVTDDPRAHAWFNNAEAEDRIVRAYRELLSGYTIDPSTLLKTTRPVHGEHSGLVTIRDINYFSICAHHFLPFFGQISVTYAPGTKIIGLGKFPRLVQAYSRRFQIQEDLVKEIAEEVMSSGEAKSVLVTSTGRHLCMCGRGPNDHTVMTDASYAMGTPKIEDLRPERLPAGRLTVPRSLEKFLNPTSAN